MGKGAESLQEPTGRSAADFECVKDGADGGGKTSDGDKFLGEGAEEMFLMDVVGAGCYFKYRCWQ